MYAWIGPEKFPVWFSWSCGLLLCTAVSGAAAALEEPSCEGAPMQSIGTRAYGQPRLG